jgi:hypothetical protein
VLATGAAAIYQALLFRVLPHLSVETPAQHADSGRPPNLAGGGRLAAADQNRI